MERGGLRCGEIVDLDAPIETTACDDAAAGRGSDSRDRVGVVVKRLWRDTALAFRQLPDVAFETVSPPVGSKTQPVVIRRIVQGDKTIFYVVNDSSRPINRSAIGQQFSAGANLIDFTFRSSLS